MKNKHGYTKKQLQIIGQHSLNISSYGILQVPRLLLQLGYGKILNDNGIKYECSDCPKLYSNVDFIMNVTSIGSYSINCRFVDNLVIELLVKAFGDRVSKISNNEMKAVDSKTYNLACDYIRDINNSIVFLIAFGDAKEEEDIKKAIELDIIESKDKFKVN